jgi:DNA-binding beta-propeller fold protein YncE
LLAAIGGVLALVPSAGAWSQSCCMPWGTPSQVAVSPDGRYAYASDASVALAFARDSSTGMLTLFDSYDGPGGGSGSSVGTELSPDGATLYNSGRWGGPLLATFRADAASGALTAAGAYRGAGAYGFGDFEFSPDGRQVYATDGYANALVTLDRDPATGVLSYRTELRSGDPGVEHLSQPTGLAISPDGRFLYVSAYGPNGGLLTFARAPGGELTQIQTLQPSGGATDIELSPDGRRLYQGPMGPHTFERDPETGLLSHGSNAGVVLSGGDSLGDGHIVVAPDNRAVYMVDNWDKRLYQFSVTADGLELTKTYREPADGQGISGAQVLSAAPDGRSVYLTSPAPHWEQGGRIAVFQREDGTNRLLFRQLVVGPKLDGRLPGEQQPPSIAINGGAEYTNDPDVVLTVKGLNPRTTMQLLVSNDGGFPEEQTEALPPADDGRYEWELATSGPERLPKTVYARPRGFAPSTILSDDIVLDQRPPQLMSVKQAAASGSGARAARSTRLRIRARDRISGVARMQVTARRGKPGKWRRFKRSARWKGERVAWVRVRDRAGNRSRWRRARRG